MAEETQPNGVEQSPITAHYEDWWFCMIQTDDDRLLDHLDEIEQQFGKEDNERRVIDELTPEETRVKNNEEPPVVGHVTHKDGEVIDVTFDLSDWY